MIKNYEMRRALTSEQLAKDTSTDVLKQLIVKNAVRLGQTLSDVEIEVIRPICKRIFPGCRFRLRR